MNTFKFIGKIKKLEDKKDRKFIETVTFDSGWMIERVKFRVVSGDCNEFIELSGGKWQDESKNTVYTFFTKDGATSKTEVEKAQVPWNDRFNPTIVEKVPKFKRFTVDLSSDKTRDELSKAGKTEEVAQLAALKYTYISNYDFTMKVEELLKTNKFGDDNYVITGTVEYTFSNKNDKGTYYRSFVPTSIYKASADDEVKCGGRIDLYYTKDNVVGEALENGDIPINGYTQFYDKMAKANFYAPIGLRIKGDKENKDGFVKMFEKLGDSEAETLVLGLNVQYYDGSEKTEITEDDFTEDQKTMIKWGLKTVEETIKEMGGSAFGDKVNYIYIDGVARGYTNGPQNPDVPAEKLYAKPDGVKKSGKTNASSVKIDLFSDDDEDDSI